MVADVVEQTGAEFVQALAGLFSVAHQVGHAAHGVGVCQGFDLGNADAIGGDGVAGDGGVVGLGCFLGFDGHVRGLRGELGVGGGLRLRHGALFAAAFADRGVGRHGDERVFQRLPIDDAISCRGVGGAFKSTGLGVERPPECGHVARAFALTTLKHTAKHGPIDFAGNVGTGLVFGVLDNPVNFVADRGFGEVVAFDQADGLAVVGVPADGHLRAQHAVGVDAGGAGHVMAAQGVPVVVVKQRPAVVQAAQADGAGRAIEDLDAEIALIRQLAGKGHVEHQILPGLGPAGVGRDGQSAVRFARKSHVRASMSGGFTHARARV